MTIADNPWRVPAKEAPPGFEPGMADLQSDAQTTELQS